MRTSSSSSTRSTVPLARIWSTNWISFRSSDAAALLDEAIHLRQTEPGPLPHFLGREKRIESFGENFLGHARARVADRDHDVLTRHDIFVRERIRFVEKCVGGFDRQFSAARHRITSVDGEIQYRVL